MPRESSYEFLFFEGIAANVIPMRFSEGMRGRLSKGISEQLKNV